MGQQAEKKEKTQRVTGLGRKTKRGDSKLDSPEISGRGKTSDIPRISLGDNCEEQSHQCPLKRKKEKKNLKKKKT